MEYVAVLSAIGILAIIILAIILLVLVKRQFGLNSLENMRTLISASEKSQSENLRLEARGIRQEVQDSLNRTGFIGDDFI